MACDKTLREKIYITAVRLDLVYEAETQAAGKEGSGMAPSGMKLR